MPQRKTDFIDKSIENLLSMGRLDPNRRRPISPDLEKEHGRPHDRLPELDLHYDAQVVPGLAHREDRPDSDEDRVSDTGVASHVIRTRQGDVWLAGNSVMCQCPDCDGPVSVRLWLMLADCWNCQSSIELSVQQRQAVERLIEQSQQSTRNETVDDSPERPVSSQPNQPEPMPAERTAALPLRFNDASPPRLVSMIRRMTNTLPAWVISSLVHIVLILILALILLPYTDDQIQITLSTTVSPDDREGGLVADVPKEVELQYDSVVPDRDDRAVPELRQAAEQDARQLQLDPGPVAAVPDIDKVRDAIQNRSAEGYTFAARDPRLRNEIVIREGGTTLSEAAVSRGLRWLASVQNKNGSWSLADFKRNRKNNSGDMAATALALLPFLGAGQTHEFGIYKKNVEAGLKWIMDHQKSNGELMYGIRTNAAIYAHGQASIVLIEALAMTGDERFRQAAQKSIDYIQAFQHKHGGWRYRFQEAGDTSVLGWQLMALQSARNSNTGLRVDQATLTLADQYLDLASRPYRKRRYRGAPTGTLYRYQPRESEPKAAMTAEGLLCRMYLGWKRNDARLIYGINWLVENALPDGRDDELNLYYFYYATQAMHHFGGRQWKIWNDHVRDLMIAKQRTGGRYAGSWDPDEFRYGDSGGRIYVTALAICTLEVYYRHLPLFKQLDLN